MSRRVAAAYGAVLVIALVAILYAILAQEPSCPEGYVATRDRDGIVCVSGVLPEVRP